MKKTKWAYLAGLIDGEGCFSVSRHPNKAPARFSYMRSANVANTDRRIMKWLVKNFGGHIKVAPLRNPDRHKRRFSWVPTGTKNLERITLAILPYLVIKREQAKLFLQFLREDRSMNPEQLDARLARKQLIWERMHELNRKGPVETETQDNRDDRLKIQSELMGDHESECAETHTS